MGRRDAVRRATAADLDRVESLLTANDLPTAGLRDARVFVATADGELRGAGGVELHGTAGLLRSLVVPAPHRGEGHGTALCEALEAAARAAGVETLYLLTTTAADFFARRGYEAVPREDAPPRIRGTAEFADLCPASATCMRASLA